jgi:hypothetical protein
VAICSTEDIIVIFSSDAAEGGINESTVKSVSPRQGTDIWFKTDLPGELFIL